MDDDRLKQRRTVAATVAPKLTEKTILTLPPGWHRSTSVPGLYLLVRETRKRGKTRTFYARFGTRGRQQAVRLGVYPGLNVAAAEREAKKVLGKAELGQDPATETRQRRTGMLFREWAETYVSEIEKTRKRAGDVRRYLAVAAEQFGRTPLAHVKQADAAAFRDSFIREEPKRGPKPSSATAKPGAVRANRALAALKACLAAAVKAGHLEANVAAAVDLRADVSPPRSRVLSDDEQRRLLKALDAEPDWIVAAVVRLALATGCRVGEALGARWADIDLEGLSWRLPSPKAGTPQHIALTPTVAKLLEGLPRFADSPWLFPGPDQTKHRASIRAGWERLAAAAQLDGVVVHDLRRTAGLALVRAAGLHVASKALRHSDARVTERVYAPLQLGDIREAMVKAEKSRVLRFKKGAA